MHKSMSFCLFILVMVLASCTTSQESTLDVSESVEPTAGQEATAGQDAQDAPAEQETEEGSAEVVPADALDREDREDRKVAEGTATLIQLQDPLDEPEYYCIDVPGFGASLDLTAALTAHTCKPNADDELFTLNAPAQGQIYAQAYDLCMQADSAEPDSALYLKSCSDSPLQRFDLMASPNAQIQLQEAASDALCVAVAAEEGQPTGGPSHLRRDLMLQSCLQVDAALSQWVTPGPDHVLSSSTLTVTSVAQASDLISPTATPTSEPISPTASPTSKPISPTRTPTSVPISPTAESEAEVITLPAGEPIKYARYLYNETISYGVLRDEDTLWRVEGDIFADHTVLAETVPLSEVQLLAPVPAANILAVGLNYASHAGTAGAAAPEMIPKLPNALAGPNDPIWMFPDASNLHYEAELVVVIGKEARNVPLESAASYVFGVTAGNDVSERNWQAQDLQWIRAKSSDSFAPIGPYIVTGLDYNDLLVQSRVNGELRQSESSAFMIHNVEALVSYISQYITLKPGDVIFTGTPGNTQAMQVGDVVEIEVQGVGVLRNTITARE